MRGQLRLGLALDPVVYKLERAKSSDSWSDRLASVVVVSAPVDIDDTIKELIKCAWERS